MAKTAMIRARVDPELKTDTETILHELGMSVTEAITLFYEQIRLNQGLPFEVCIPNETTLRTLREAEAGENVVAYASAEEMFEKLGL